MSHQLVLLDINVQRSVHSSFDWEKHWREFKYFETEGFTGLVKAVARGDSALEDEILRRWGIR